MPPRIPSPIPMILEPQIPEGIPWFLQIFFEEWPWESGRGEGFGIPLDLPRSLQIPREAPRNPGSFRVGFGGVGIPSFQSFFGG